MAIFIFYLLTYHNDIGGINLSKYGLKIKNIEAGILYEYNLGVRDHYDTTDAMLTKSLFYDYLEEIGMETYNDESTQDLICIEFGFGSSSYDEHIKKLNRALKRANKDNDKEKVCRLNDIIDKAKANKDLYVKKTAQELRTLFYKEGVDVRYCFKNKKGVLKVDKIIHYKMLYRTPGKAKQGSCMFINEKLYDKANKFLMMGIELPYHNAPIVEIGAYSSLVTSTIVGKVKIKPNEILILKDVDRFMTTNVISVETDKNKRCYAKNIKDYQLKNTLFDGQALIDESIFPNWGDGYILLRHHFFKAAAFKTRIQLFFKEYYGEDYENAVVQDLWGNKVRVRDIKLITTENATKWIKFSVSPEYWFNWIEKNDSNFGIVKTAHKSKLGNVQRMSYQMINSLNIDDMPKIVEKSIEYIEKLKTDDDFFLDYLRQNVNFSNDFDVLVALCEDNPLFVRSEYFKERRQSIISSYVMKFKNGKVIQEADNLVIVGSPYAMLLHSVGENVDLDDTFQIEDGCIQCYTERFNDGEYLAEFRSPFNSRNSLGCLHNILHPKIKKYFDFGKQIIAVNMIGTDLQDKNNGSDQDSDSLYVTNQQEIVNHAKYCMKNYPTIVNNIPKEKNHYNNTLEDKALVDNRIAAGNMAIGESSNLAQIALTYSYNFDDKKYIDYVCILSVLAQAAIDNAKRTFDVDLNEEITRIKKDLDIEINGLPSFWFILQRKNKFSKKLEETVEEKKKRKKKEKDRINSLLVCPMNYLYDLKLEKKHLSEHDIPMSNFFVKFPLEKSRRRSFKVEKLIEKYSAELLKYNTGKDVSYPVLENDFDVLIKDIKSVYLSDKYIGLMSWLIDRTFYITPQIKSKKEECFSTLNKNRAVLLKVLYKINPNSLKKCFSANKM